MEASCRNLCVLLLLCGMASGCGLNTAILQKGGSDRKGVLLNYSSGAHPGDPIDSSKPTIVITHGWNPLPKRIHASFGLAGARAIKGRCGDAYNLLSWDWNGVKVSLLHQEPARVSKCQGRMLAAALRARGVDPGSTQMIGHSLGTLVVTQAAVCLSDLGPMAQLTLLDSPTQLHEEIFCKLVATRHAEVVENYWAPGISGYGKHADHRGVRNYKVRGSTPIRGMVDLSVSNHVYVVRWYHKTMCCPSMPYGFQRSVILGWCGGRPCSEAEESEATSLARRRLASHR